MPKLLYTYKAFSTSSRHKRGSREEPSHKPIPEGFTNLGLSDTHTFAHARPPVPRRPRQREYDPQQMPHHILAPIQPRQATVEDSNHDFYETPRRQHFGSETSHIHSAGEESSVPSVLREDDLNPSRLPEIFSDGGSVHSVENLRGGPETLPNLYPQNDQEPPFILNPPSRTHSERIQDELRDYDRQRPLPDESAAWDHSFNTYQYSGHHAPREAPVKTRDEEVIEARTREYEQHSHIAGFAQQQNGQATYYIVPSGLNVIFQDELGNEITRVGNFQKPSRPRRRHGLVIVDERGRELYRSDDGSASGSTRSHHRESNVTYLDPYEFNNHRSREIPIHSSRRSSDHSRRSRHSTYHR